MSSRGSVTFYNFHKSLHASNRARSNQLFHVAIKILPELLKLAPVTRMVFVIFSKPAFNSDRVENHFVIRRWNYQLRKKKVPRYI